MPEQPGSKDLVPDGVRSMVKTCPAGREGMRLATVSRARGTNMDCRRVLFVTIFAASLAAAAPADAGEVVTSEETLDVNRPESWAMKYYTSLTLFTGVDMPQYRRTGEVDLALEGGHVPQLSEDQRRVGFDGTKVEDVNKTQFFGRLRGSVGLGKGFALEVGYTPPLKVGGARPNLLALALGRPFDLSSFRLGIRGFGQIGAIDADITCGAGEVAAGRDPQRNPLDCVEPSQDRSHQKVAGLELVAGYDGWKHLKPHVGVGVNYMDLQFDINALYAGGLVSDHETQRTSGTTASATAGVTVDVNRRLRLGAEVFYSWLSVVRPPATAAVNDGLLNFRFLVSYRVLDGRAHGGAAAAR
jgi:opacity protein-like surface antigen